MTARITVGFHELATASQTQVIGTTIRMDMAFTYTFQNFFHPFVGELISKLNRESLPGMLDAAWQDGLKTPDPETDPTHDFFNDLYNPQSYLVNVKHFRKEIDVGGRGPYANYNWELLFHIPLTIAVHLSKSQRFAEAQRWFHYIFDPTSNDQSLAPPQRFWKFLAFRDGKRAKQIDELLALLSRPADKLSTSDQELRADILDGYNAILRKPFQPHAVARTRPLAYQYCVVMKYLDNLIAWGDNLFQQDTAESINEATQRYVLAANLLGPRPQRIPPRGMVRAKSFAQLKRARPRDSQGKDVGDPLGNVLVELEGQFPFNLNAPNPDGSGGSTAGAAPLFGIGRTLYFCVPRNEKLLGYWDTVADRLFKIRHCMNIAGVVRPLALFDPPLDPGMLVKAAAAGIDIRSIVSGLNQPVGPVRCLTLIQKALELCNEVRGLGGSLLAALEKGDAEHFALVRQSHEIKIQEMAQEVRFLQWKSAQEATTSLLTSRRTALERYHYYQRVLGLQADPNAPDTLTLDRRELTEENFDEAYGVLVGQYEKNLSLQQFPPSPITGSTSPAQQSGASGQGRFYLSANEDAELNKHLPAARNIRLAASIHDAIAAVLTFVPDFDAKVAFWGVGASARVFGGGKLHDATKGAADILRMAAAWEQDQAVMTGRTAGHERRADEWLLQHNLAAHELMQIGRQILTALIAEQVAHHEYLNVQQQMKHAREVEQALRAKFSNEELYLWMQGEAARLFYEYYRLAYDTARKAERAMRHELMRPELDERDFVKFNYWDAGRKGLLSGEALHLDVKRMEMAFHEHNRREIELTRHVSLRQLDPLALLELKVGGKCTVTIPEWLYDRDCPGHYMRRIKSVALSIPSVVGPYTSVNCTLSLLESTLRKSPEGDSYARQGREDERFVDFGGGVQSIVTSTGGNDSGLFETNLRDERYLPFEGAGAESTWRLDLPTQYPAFDYATISDIILHVRYTARQGVPPQKVTNALDAMFQGEGRLDLALLFSLRHDFPTEWAAFVNGAGAFNATIRKDFFPYFAQSKTITISGLDLYAPDGQGGLNRVEVGDPPEWDAAETGLKGKDRNFTLNIAEGQVLKRAADAQVFLIVRYSF